MSKEAKKYAMSVIVLFAFIWLFEWIVHTQILMNMYLETISLWRPLNEMKDYGQYLLVVYLLYAVIFTSLYKRYVNAKNLTDAASFGFLVGAIVGVWNFGAYVYMPISLGLAACWFLASAVAGAVSGMLLRLLNCKK